MEKFEDNEYLILRGTIFQDLFNDKKLTDVVIETNDGTQFPCHKIILMAGCPFFRGLFTSDMIESQQKVVNLKKIDISGPHFKQILEYIYTGKIELGFEDAKALNIYSGLFTMKNLRNFCENCLIKNIGNQTYQTCLNLWRHAEKYLNDNLKDSCMELASTKIFLDAHIHDLTLEEIKSIASLKKRNCTSQTLLENIVKWIKLDFENRRQHLIDLMEFINFDNIEDEYKRKLFSDELLIQSNEFLTLTRKCFLSHLRKKKLFVLTNEKVFHTNFDTKECKPTALCPKSNWFAMSRNTRNGFLITGGYQTRGYLLNSCKQFCPSTSEIIEFPPLIKGRMHHKNYTLGNKIYVCGGSNTKTVEIYEENLGKWITGPDMSEIRFSFGSADDNENSLYAVGGINPNVFDSIAHLDTRTYKWQTIYNDPSIALGFTQSLYKDSQIYGFGINEGYIFDVRANKKLSTIPYELNNDINFQFTELNDGWLGYNIGCYGCIIAEDDICIVGKMSVNNVAESSSSLIKFDLQTNTWDRQICKGLPGTSVLGLIWCNNN